MNFFLTFFFAFSIAGLELVNVESQTDISKKLIGMLASDKLPHNAGIVKAKPSHVASPFPDTCLGRFAIKN